MTPRLLTVALVLLTGYSLTAQTFAPLGSYEALYLDAPPPAATEKVACDEFDLTDVFVVRPGTTSEFSATPDTSRLSDVTGFSCTGCNETEGGSTVLRGDTVVFTAAEGIEEMLNEVTITARDAAGDRSDPFTVRILIQRPGQAIELDDVTLTPEEEVGLTIPRNDFTAAAVCRSLELCSDGYAGRGQVAEFTSAQATGNDVRYTAARYGGTDRVCVTLCSAFGLCDTFRTSIDVVRPSVGLPFFDDFSGSIVRPDGELWQDIDVIVNRTYADTPPSIGVATFDALALDGKPYPLGQNNRNGAVRDYLTSVPLNLVGQSGAALSFYLQPRGFGNRPEIQDSFLVQFLASDGDWRTVQKVAGLSTSYPGSSPVTFTPYTLPVTDEYLYDGFAFRFASKSSERGAVDMWHLDYVKLTTDGQGVATADVALTQPPGSILGPITSLPLRHFQAAGEDLIRPRLSASIFNNDDEQMTLDAEKNSVIDVQRGRTLITRATMTDGDVFGLPITVPAMTLERRAVIPEWGGFNDIRNFLNDLNEEQEAEPIVLTTTYLMSFLGENFRLGAGIDDNNMSTSTTVLGEYMAYDDGTAEGTIEAQRRTVVTQRYTAYVADELRGIQIRLPRSLNAPGDQPLRLVVYEGDDRPEGRLYTEDVPILYAETFSDSLQGYTTYLFDEPLPLPEGNFFVGWEQVGDTPIGVGYDRNSDSRDFQFFDLGNNGEWQQLQPFPGALMVRPLLADFGEPATSTEGDFGPEGLADVFPNPTTGTLHLRPRPGTNAARLRVDIYAATGALLRSVAGPRTLDLSTLPPGLYLLDVTDGKRRSRHKVVLH